MIVNRPFPISRPHVEFDPVYHEAVGRALEKLAAEDPTMQPMLDAWREGNVMIDEWEAKAARAAADTAAPTAPAPHPQRTPKKQAPRRASRPMKTKVARAVDRRG